MSSPSSFNVCINLDCERDYTQRRRGCLRHNLETTQRPNIISLFSFWDSIEFYGKESVARVQLRSNWAPSHPLSRSVLCAALFFLALITSIARFIQSTKRYKFRTTNCLVDAAIGVCLATILDPRVPFHRGPTVYST